MPFETYLPILIYFAFLLIVGFSLRKKAGKNTKEFFLAGRNLPWWLAGTSIVATTFAADTPLVITGLIASKGMSGNWFWFAPIISHALVVVIFSKYWSRAATVTDTEIISLRYSGKSADYLRIFRALLAGLFINCVIMGWVIKAMVKISGQFFDWQLMMPSFYGFFDAIWPHVGVLGSTSDAITILFLVGLIVLYSSMGGLRAVIITDFIQFALAVFAGGFLAWEVWQAVGGREGLITGLQSLYGPNHSYTNLIPASEGSWLKDLGIGYGFFMLYLIVQSVSRLDVDGSGYFMQRMNSCKSDQEAKKATLLFVFLHYLFRAWPWMVVGMGALILIPMGQETTVFNGAAAEIAKDRELAYPFLMNQFLSPFILGLLLTSFLAAFMSTMDTHLNWGASYIVNDWLPRLNPNIKQRTKTIISRLAIVFFGLLAILTSFQITSIEVAWKWLFTFAAALGLPNIIRWFWWRVTAVSEILAMVLGLLTALILFLMGVEYEVRLIYVSFAGLIGLFLGILFGPPNDPEKIESFYQQIRPVGVWPRATVIPYKDILQAIAIIATGVFGLWLGKGLLFGF